MKSVVVAALLLSVACVHAANLPEEHMNVTQMIAYWGKKRRVVCV